jgi:hypothetical protein
MLLHKISNSLSKGLLLFLLTLLPAINISAPINKSYSGNNGSEFRYKKLKNTNISVSGEAIKNSTYINHFASHDCDENFHKPF